MARSSRSECAPAGPMARAAVPSSPRLRPSAPASPSRRVLRPRALVLLICGRWCGHRRRVADGCRGTARLAAAVVAPPEQEDGRADRDTYDKRAHTDRVGLAGGDL